MPKQKKHTIGKSVLQMRIPDEYMQLLQQMAEEEAEVSGIPRSEGMIGRDLFVKTLKQLKDAREKKK